MKYALPVAVVASLLCAVSAAAEARPGTPKIPVSNSYHGVTVVDDYRWLENGDAVRVKAWSEAQNARARAFLDRLPGTAALSARIEHLLTARPASISGLDSKGGKHFAVCFDPARKQQPWIVLLPSLTSAEGMRAIVDPNVLDRNGHTSFDWFVPSPDGSRIAVSLSEGGSEAGTLHVYEVATGRDTGDVIPLVQKGTAGGSAAWTADGKGLFYTRYPREGERPKEDQRAGVIEAIAPTRTRLFTIEASGGKSRLRSYDFEGNLVEELPTPAASALVSLSRLEGDAVAYGVTSFLQPETGYVYDPVKKVSTPTVVRTTPVADFSDAEVIEERAISKDGTLVPMFILQPKGTKRDGRNPVVLTGYGGFGVSQRPSHSDLAHVLTERGVVQVSAILRGGGEFGEEWHDAGRLTRKQNVFDDFLACARRLIELKITRPERLAIEGGSNGGLLMGAAFTQTPKLFRAVVSHVGIYDMLRVEASPNGQFNTVEYGTVKVPEQFKALYAYSPYHRVRNGTRYPAILMPTGANDPRVDPMQSRKMVARLQAADPKATVLLRTSGSTGHGGIGASVKDAVSLLTDVDAFLLHELGAPPARN